MQFGRVGKGRQCDWPGCTARIQARFTHCRYHWDKIPVELRDALVKHRLNCNPLQLKAAEMELKRFYREQAGAAQEGA